MKTFEKTYIKQKEDYMELCQFRLAKEANKLMKEENLKFEIQLTRDYIGFKNDEVTFLAIRLDTPKQLVLDIKVPEEQDKLCPYFIKRYDQNFRVAIYDFTIGITDLREFRPILLEAYKVKRKTN